ncbi:EF-hand domain-containing protein [Sphingomonas sp. GB1N7]|uniref:EF-hand domain-containing protein n=1 Tax=Parasphingomonas caseinilytica TaxID=3096158 RepID=UPI002FC6DD23
MPKPTPSICLALALAAALPASAQQAPPPPAPTTRPQPFATIVFEPAAMMIAACDANSDAVVTRDELHACLKRSFASVAQGKADIGYIDYSDWAKTWLGDANVVPSPYSVDTDDDNRITLAELQAEFDRFFDRFDTDKNGSVTRAELITLRTAPSIPPGKKKR